jgi:hypothetical protein
MIDSVQRRLVFLLLLFTLFQTGCGIQADPAAEKAAKVAAEAAAEQELAEEVLGEWVLDLDATLTESKASLSSVVDIDVYSAELKNSILEFQLYEDGTFSCRQAIAGEDAKYTGLFVTKGKLLILNQTHREEELEADQLKGELKKERLHLIHEQQGFEIPYVLRRPE